VSFTYDLATDLGVVRLILTDVSAATPLFQDAEITAFLTMESGDLKLAAAQALDTIATNEALVYKAIRILDLSTDGSKTAASLMARAQKLRDQVKEDEAAAEAGTDFDWAEMVEDAASERERIISQALRGAI